MQYAGCASEGTIGPEEYPHGCDCLECQRQRGRVEHHGNVIVIRAPEKIPEPIWTGTKTRREYTDRRPRRGKFKRRSRGK